MSSVAPALECKNLTKTFAGRAALSSVDLSIEPGQVQAVIGENGSGKSTLVKVISGYHRPDHGSEILIGGRPLHHGVREASVSESSRKAGARFVHQDLGLVDALSVQDNLSLGPGFPTRFGTIRARSLRELVAENLAAVDLDIDPRRLVGDLLPAEKTGVAVARALRRDPGTDIHLLVLDEPTATLPAREVESLLSMVRSVARQGIGVLYISHHLDEVFDVADEVTVLRDGKVVTSQPAATLTHNTLVAYLLGEEVEDTRRRVPHRPDKSAEVALRTHSLSAKNLAELSLEASRGEVVGIAGITGSGREWVCQAIFGGIDRRAGEVHVNGRNIPPGKPHVSISAGMAYLPADRKQSGLFLDLTAQENLTISNLRPYWKRLLLRRAAERRDAARLFDTYDIRPRHSVRSPLRTLSGGNQQKVMFAKWIRRSPEVLLFDEPTQGVDLGARAAMHQHILDAAGRGAAVVVSSADLDELEALCHRVLIFRQGQVVDSLQGSQVKVPALSRAILGSAE